MQGEFLVSGDPMIAEVRSGCRAVPRPGGRGSIQARPDDRRTQHVSPSPISASPRGKAISAPNAVFPVPGPRSTPEINIGGFPILGGDIEARPRLAKVGRHRDRDPFRRRSSPDSTHFRRQRSSKVLKRFLNLGLEDLQKCSGGHSQRQLHAEPLQRFRQWRRMEWVATAMERMARAAARAEKSGDADRERIEEEPETAGDPPEHGTTAACRG